MDRLSKEELKAGFERIGASYRALPTDELLGELKHLQRWTQDFVAEASKHPDKHLVGSGLLITMPFLMEALEALYPKLEVLFGIHPTDAKDNGMARKQVVDILTRILSERSTP